MNKKNVEKYFESAYHSVDAVLRTGLIKPEEIGKYRSQIASFGAAISMGSLKAALLFFSVQGKSDINRAILLNLIYSTLRGKTEDTIAETDVKAENVLFFNEVSKNTYTKQDIIEAAIAVKLVFNLFMADKADQKEKTDE